MALWKTLTELEYEADDLRSRITALPDERRVEFYRREQALIKDPDTYAVLNYFLFGLHHFYLGRWLWGTFNLLLFAVGVITFAAGGFLLIILLLLLELPQLFFSQRIVFSHNNRVTRRLLEEFERGITR